jgi:putative cardiolipin synthase
MIIESEALANTLAQAIETNMAPTNSWRVTRLDGQLRWDTDRNGPLEMTHEPDTSWWRRTKSGFIALFPLEKYF